MNKYEKPIFKIEYLYPSNQVANEIIPFQNDVPEVDLSNWDNMWD